MEMAAYIRQEWEPIQNFFVPRLSDAYMPELFLRLWVASFPHAEKDSRCFAELLVVHLNPASNSEVSRPPSAN